MFNNRTTLANTKVHLLSTFKLFLSYILHFSLYFYSVFAIATEDFLINSSQPSQIRCQQLGGVEPYTCNGNLFDSDINEWGAILSASIDIVRSKRLFGQEVTISFQSCLPSSTTINGCGSILSSSSRVEIVSRAPSAQSLYGSDRSWTNLMLKFNTNDANCVTYLNYGWNLNAASGSKLFQTDVCFISFGYGESLFGMDQAESTAFFDALAVDNKKVNFICAYALNVNSEGEAMAASLVGCVNSGNARFPPIFNPTLLPVSNYLPNVIFPSRDPGKLLEWFRSNNSLFEAPVLILNELVTENQNTEQYSYMGTYAINSSHPLQCKAMAPLNSGQPPLKNQYCLLMPNDQDLCLYKNPAVDPDDFDLYKFQVQNLKSFQGCVPRPAIEQNSNISIISYYQSAVDTDNNVYQGVVPILVEGAYKSAPIAKDLDGSSILIGKNYQLYRALDGHYPQCDIAWNLAAYANNFYDIVPFYGNAPCTLASGISLSVLPFMVQEAPTPVSGGIREFFATTGSEGCISYVRDTASLPTYNLSVQAVIPSFNGLGDLQYEFIVPYSNISAFNCLAYYSVYGNNSAPTGKPYLIPGGQRSNQYCFCGGPNSPYPIANSLPLPNTSTCNCPICYGIDLDENAIEPAICPGIYNGPISSTSSDQICLMTTSANWDFVTGHNLFNNPNGNGTSQVPGIICTPLSVQCKINYNSNKIVPNLGNAMWQNGNISFGSTTTGTCDTSSGFTYSYSNSGFAINFPNNITNATASQQLQQIISQLPPGQTLRESLMQPYSELWAAYEQYGLSCQFAAPTATCIGGILGNVQNPCILNNQQAQLKCTATSGP